MAKRKKDIIGVLENLDLDVELHESAIPMVGWHEQSATVDVEGEKWRVSIAGGCQAVWLNRVSSEESKGYSVSVGQIVPALIAFIKERERKTNEHKK